MHLVLCLNWIQWIQKFCIVRYVRPVTVHSSEDLRSTLIYTRSSADVNHPHEMLASERSEVCAHTDLYLGFRGTCRQESTLLVTCYE